MLRRPRLKIAILLALGAAATVGSEARADEPAPQPAAPEPKPVAPAQVADGTILPPEAPAAEAAVDPDAATDAEVAKLVGSEVVQIWDERPDKPFDRDTEVRLTGEDLAARGATDLASALALVPDLFVRESGRGGQIVDIRGAKKNEVKIIVDGIAVSDPYYGTFDVSSIPVTDIVQIRVSTSPSSPIDGLGGSGGVIEVHTRDAVGARMVVGRAIASSLPVFNASATGKAEVAKHVGVRASATGASGNQEYTMPTGTIGQQQRATTGALRVEYRDGDRRFAADAWLDHRSYVTPPSEDVAADILVVDGETSARGAAAFDDKLGRWQVSSHLWAQSMTRASRYYHDVSLTMLDAHEDLSAVRTGGAALATHPIGKTLRAIGAAAIDRESVDVGSDSGRVTGASTLGEFAGGGQYEDGAWRVDGAVGEAVPLAVEHAAPWTEAKLAVAFRPVQAVTLTATGARKGRLPTLRERFRLDVGNQALGAEISDFAELEAKVAPGAGVELSSSGWVRRTDGLIKLDNTTMKLSNLGNVDFKGLDARIKVAPGGPWSVGASWSYERADSDALGANPVDFLPAHRGDVWAQLAAGRHLTLLGQVRHVGHRTDRGVQLDSYDTLDVSAQARLGGDWLGVLRCDDCTDERWQIRQDVHAPGRIVSLSVQGTWQ